MATSPGSSGLLRSATSALRRWLTARPGGAGAGGATAAQPTAPATSYPGDFTGPLTPEYAPDPDGRPDPGEIVWTWVPYEEDHSRGKDRPVLLVGRDGPWLLALQLTSKDHDGTPTRDGRRHWVDIGAGAGTARGARARCASTGSCGWGRMPCAARVRCSPPSASRRWPMPWPASRADNRRGPGQA